MKKLFTFISIIAATYTVNAQSSLQTQNVTNTIYGLPTDFTLVAMFDVYNSSANTLDVMCERTEISVVPGSENSFCWGALCYPSTVSLSAQPATIAPGGIESTFRGDYSPWNTVGLSTVQYRFFDSNNPSDEATVIIYYDTNPLGVHNASVSSNYLNASYNSGSSLMAISYSLQSPQPAQIKIIDMLGNTLKSFPVNKSSGNIIVSTSGMSSGVYFVSMITSDKSLANKKLVISNR